MVTITGEEACRYTGQPMCSFFFRHTGPSEPWRTRSHAAATAAGHKSDSSRLHGHRCDDCNARKTIAGVFERLIKRPQSTSQRLERKLY